MKRFLKLFLLFFIPLLCVLGAMEYAVRQVPNEYSYKAEWMEKNADRVETLILGTSHAFYGINPAYLGPNAFSLANLSQTLCYDFFLFNKYLNNCNNLKIVIVTLSSFSLNIRDLEEGVEKWRVANYKVYFDCPYHSSFSKYNFFISNSEPFRKKLFNFFSDNIIACDSLGFTSEFKSSFSPSNAPIKIWERSHNKIDIERVERNKLYLKSMARLCLSNNIKLIVVSTPVFETYYKHLDTKELYVMKSFAKFLSREYKITYLDYMCDKRFTSSDFKDWHHLSYDGAKKLSKIIANDLVRHTD